MFGTIRAGRTSAIWPVAIVAVLAASFASSGHPASARTTAKVSEASASAAPCCAHWFTDPYLGVGAWVDVFDWTIEHATAPGGPRVGPSQVHDMAAAGVQTLYIQTARTNSSADIAEPERLQQFIDVAHARGMDVVGWYLPTLGDPEKDLRRMIAATTLDLDGFSVNIESTEVRDVAERNRRLVDVSRRFKEHVGSGVLGTVVLNAFAIEELRPDVWPDFPWAAIRPYYDVWQPMAYVTFRTGTEWRDAERYTAASIDAMRRHVGSEIIHVVTGIGDDMTTTDVDGFARASQARGARGGSIYDWATAVPALWNAMRPLRRGPVRGGTDTPGVVRDGTWLLRNTNTPGPATITATLLDSPGGQPITGGVPLAGDWDGDGVDTIGVVVGNTFRLRNRATTSSADLVVTYGRPGDVPVVGDWDGNGTDTIGIRRGNIFHLRNTNTPGIADLTFGYGRAGDVPVVGDWDGNGTDTIGIRRGKDFHLRNTNTPGNAHTTFGYGLPADTPLVGDWDGNRTDTIGIRRGKDFHLRNTNTPGNAHTSFGYGLAGDVPVAGDWDGR